MKITVLLSSYNGEKYIEEQLNSIFEQTCENVSVLVRDDGSKDGTINILEKYRSQGRLDFYSGNNLGCAKSFWHLLCSCGDSDYYAFCDQDDVWDRDKLEIAVNMLEKENKDIPLLYFGDVRVTDSALNVISGGMVEKMPVTYPHSLIKNVAPGCTYVFNRKAAEILRKYDCDKYGIDIHDWTVYKIINCFGKAVFDEKPHMSYRQHGNNEIGATKKGISGAISAAKRFSNGKMTNSRERNAQRLLQCYGDMMSEENLRYTRLMAEYRKDKKIKSELFRCPAFRFHGLKHAYFRFMILTEKI